MMIESFIVSAFSDRSKRTQSLSPDRIKHRYRRKRVFGSYSQGLRLLHCTSLRRRGNRDHDQQGKPRHLGVIEIADSEVGTDMRNQGCAKKPKKPLAVAVTVTPGRLQ